MKSIVLTRFGVLDRAELDYWFERAERASAIAREADGAARFELLAIARECLERATRRGGLAPGGSA